MNASRVLLLLAVICFVLAALPVVVGFNLVAIGLAFGFASFLA